MQILFLSLLDFNSFEERNIYTDLLRQFMKQGHQVYCISPAERRTGVDTHLEENGHLLRLKVGNLQKTHFIEKGIATLLIEHQMVWAIKKYFSHIRFDLILYATPPITFAGAVKYAKKRNKASTYLMLKDIFPQNALDLGVMRTKGLKSPIYRFFRWKEKKLYSLSDRIGCMSQANVNYLLAHNPEIRPEQVEVCPNCIAVSDAIVTLQQRQQIRAQYGIPQDKKVFVYGGNLGKPQDVAYIADCLKACQKLEDCYFVVAGNGTDRPLMEAYMAQEKPKHVKLLPQLPKEEYDTLISSCDVGLIFLDHRFTIPNFPSRILSYMQAKLPVLACTDPSTDVGKVITQGNFGWWCESKDTDTFVNAVVAACGQSAQALGENAFAYLKDHYDVAHACRVIEDGVKMEAVNG